MRTATETIDRPNMRLRRATVLTAHIMQIVGPYLCDHDEDQPRPHKHVSNLLMERFLQDGVEVLTDYDRQQYGLPPRGPDGWTVEEMVALEEKRLEILRRPISMVVPEFIPPKGAGTSQNNP